MDVSEPTLSVLGSLDAGSQFLWENKLHIKTDTKPPLQWAKIYCVEFYAGRLRSLPESQLVQKVS